MSNLPSKDEHIRQQALDPQHSFIVQAPAGSGKTELLIQRFLNLLTTVHRPEEILALTFTKKAANEMRSRIINALKQAREPEPQAEHAKKTWRIARQVLQRDQHYQWNLCDNPNQLRIQTIDALCAYLTKQLPLLANFGAQVEINPTPELLYSVAVEEVLSHIEKDYMWSSSITNLLLHLDNDLNRLHDLLVAMLAKRDQWLPYIHFKAEPQRIRQELEAHLSNVIAEHLTTLKNLFPSHILLELITIARFASSHQPLQTSMQLQLNEVPNEDHDCLPTWKYLATLLLTRDHSWRKRFTSDIGFPSLNQLQNKEEKQHHTEFRLRLTTLINELSVHEELRLALAELFLLPNPYYSDAQWEILQDLLQVLKIVAAQLRVVFQTHGKVDFIENAQAALLALGDEHHPTDLALALDYQIQHLLVDEFQDTSITQFQLIEKLIAGWEPNDGRTLFIVGDPMQSIYRFREAEVGLFLRLRTQRLGQIQLIPLTLVLNFRSVPGLIRWNNHFFSTIFPKNNHVATGAVTFTESHSNKNDDSIITKTEIRGFENGTEAIQANDIVTLISTLQEHHPDDTIAILVRSRTHLNHIVPALKKAHINFFARDIDPLASRQCIQDVYALTCALLYPADRISWFAILRAPWCGFTLADLLLVAGENAYEPIYNRLMSDQLSLSDDGNARLQRIKPILKHQCNERNRESLRRWVEETWILLGGPATLHEPHDIEDVKTYFDLLETLDQTSFSLSLEQLKYKIHELYASSKQRCPLQLMTIHAAKGLEFDHVLLPHLERKMPVDDKPLLSWMEYPLTHTSSAALLLAPIHAIGADKDPVYEFIHKQLRLKSALETDRLFYVAATRAKKQLYLFFNLQRNADNKPDIEAGSFLQKLWPFIANHLEDDNIVLSAHENESETLTHQKRFITRLITEWKNPILPKEKVVSFHQQSIGFKLVDNTAAHIGTLAHKILQQIALRGISWWKQMANTQLVYITQQLKQQGLMIEELENATTIIANILQNATTDRRGQWILSARAEARCEFALTVTAENQITERIVIDRTFIDEDGNRWIIDYKTTALTHQDVTQFLEDEKEKYLVQMHKYALAIQHLDQRTVRLGLYFPALPAWQEWTFDD